MNSFLLLAFLLVSLVVISDSQPSDTRGKTRRAVLEDPLRRVGAPEAPGKSKGSSGKEKLPEGLGDEGSGENPEPPGGGPSDPCKEKSCGGGGSCVNLHDTFFCLCVQGYYYDTFASVCEKGKTFPGDITVNIDDISDLENKNSLAYQNLHYKVNEFFKKAFVDTAEYKQTVILRISMSPLSMRSAVHARTQAVYLSVVNIFNQDSLESETSITQKINEAIKQSPSVVSSYAQQDMCDYYGCENNTADGCQDGLQCTCKAGLERPNPQSAVCVPIQCKESCSSERKEQCVKTDNGLPECVCLPDYKRDSSGKCTECPFGYRGMDCKDPFQLILTIVGTIDGIFILSLLIALIVFARSRSKNRSVEKQKLVDDDFQNLRLHTMGISNFEAEGRIFPKAKVATLRDCQAPNSYIKQRSTPRTDY